MPGVGFSIESSPTTSSSHVGVANGSSARTPWVNLPTHSHMTTHVKNCALGDESGGPSFADSPLFQHGVFMIAFDHHSLV